MGHVLTQSGKSIKNIGWRVTLAGTGINLALGILYTWSVISAHVPKEWGWDEAEKSWPYSIALLVFAFVMVPAGRIQDRIGPRVVATIGGVLVGLGFILASTQTSFVGYIIGFGLLAGAGIGCGYASATPPAVKWFPKAKTGTIAGIVVSGFGLASVYASPLSKWLIGMYAVQGAMLILGIMFFVVIVLLAQFLKAPPELLAFPGASGSTAIASTKKVDFGSFEMLKTPQFYLLWFMYACGGGAGLMIVGKLAKIADAQAGLKLGFVLVAILAIGNGAGRIIAGTVSDKIGRKATLIGCFIIQAILMLVLTQVKQDSFLANAVILGVISALIGANYGANLALFPAITKDYFGLKNFGMNYGLVFTAWGVGGFLLSLLIGWIHVQRGDFIPAYFVASGLLVLAAIVALFVKAPQHQLADAAV